MLEMAVYTMVACLGFLIICDVVRPDYPPPSADGHQYYSRRESIRDPASSFGSDWNSGKDWILGVGMNPAKCIDIPANLSLCRGIGYGQMRLPNLLEHDTLKEVSQQASSWVRLLGARCHADTQIFLCSLFAPVCLDRPIWPCRSLCDAVKSGCETTMLKYGFPWPEMLRCEQFPLENDLCIGLRSEELAGEGETCQACSQPDTYENIIDSYCSAEFVMRVRVEQSLVSNSDLKVVTSKKKKTYKSGSLKTKDLRETSLYIDGGSTCECSRLDAVSGGTTGKNTGVYLVMGHKTNERLTLSFVQKIDKKSKDMSRAMKAIRNEDVCRPVVVKVEDRKKPGGKSGGKSVGAKTTTTVAPGKVLNEGGEKRKNGGRKTTGNEAKRVLKNKNARPQVVERQLPLANEPRNTRKDGKQPKPSANP